MRELLELALTALRPLERIAVEYEKGELKECQPGPDLDRDKETELVSSCGGRPLLTLGDAYKAREAATALTREMTRLIREAAKSRM